MAKRLQGQLVLQEQGEKAETAKKDWAGLNSEVSGRERKRVLGSIERKMQRGRKGHGRRRWNL